jgi:D-glycero-alpha-D-manno-heptose 1-phosphate guanylyltransferase
MKEAIILAGGFGTRLKHIISDVPKPMAPILGEPFLSFLFGRLKEAGIEHIVLSTGYLHEKIEGFYGNEFEGIRLSYSQETDPLGTGGAMLFGMEKTSAGQVLVLNGDTLFDIDFDALYRFHEATNADLSVALRRVEDVARYGSVQINEQGRIVAFTEKNQLSGEGLINGGIYLIDKKWFQDLGLPAKFSFEKEVLESVYEKAEFYGLDFQSYFIDIGVPEDYARAQIEFKTL